MNSQLPGPLTVAAMQVTNRSNPLASNLIKPPVNRNPLASALEVGYADGGQVEETTDQMIARMAAKYGTGSAKPAAEAAPPPPTPAPQPAPAQPQSDSGIVGLLKWRRSQIDKAANYAQGGKIRGPGTPTSDSIPAKVKQTGKPISVSTGERILSHEQDALIEELAKKLGFSSLNELLESGTGRPVGPTIKRGSAAAEFGAKIDGDPTAQAASPMAAYNPIATNDTYAMAKSQQPATPVEKPAKRPGFQAGDASMQAADPKGYAAVAATQPGAQERLFSAAKPFPSSANPLVAEFAKTPEAPASQPYVDGSQAIKPAAPSVQPTNSFSESGTTASQRNPLTTINMSPNNESLARANTIRQSMIDGDGSGPKVAMLGDSGRAESQALMDKWGREDQTVAMMQEMERNPKAAGAIANLIHTQQGSDTAREELANRRQIAGDETETRRMGLDVAMRGQDIEAQTRAAQIAGNPLANLLTQTKIDSERAGIDSTRQRNEDIARLKNETDPVKRQTLIDNLLVAQGKDPSSAERLTLPMMRSNLEIDKARQAVSGLSPDEIRRKTAKQTDTGRDNPDFDPALETAVKLANRRKVGADEWFDQRQAGEQKPQGTDGDAMTRFKADPTMKGNTLGKQTESGTEVLDSTGKLIGHYR